MGGCLESWAYIRGGRLLSSRRQLMDDTMYCIYAVVMVYMYVISAHVSILLDSNSDRQTNTETGLILRFDFLRAGNKLATPQLQCIRLSQVKPVIW